MLEIQHLPKVAVFLFSTVQPNQMSNLSLFLSFSCLRTGE